MSLGHRKALRRRIGGLAGLAQIVVHRSVEDDAGVVVQQRSSGLDREESGTTLAAIEL
jgi:hypothetical protein